MIEIANPGTSSADVEVYVAGASKGSYSIPAGGAAEASFPGLMDGPVKVTSTNGTPVVASMWTIWRNSFNQSMGVSTNSLSGDYYFPYYDQSSHTGQTEWVFALNPNPSSIYCEVSIAGNLKWSGTIASDGKVFPMFPGDSGGPVEVRSWTDSSKTSPAPVFTTERILTSPDNFEEHPGTSVSSLSDTYYLSRFDNHYPGLVSQLQIANASDQAANVSVYMGTDTVPAATLSLAAHSASEPSITTTPPFEKGPVRIVSQGGQVLIAGEEYIVKEPTNHYFTWYDTTFGHTWLLMAQPRGTGSGSYDMNIPSMPDIQNQTVADSSTVPRIFNNKLGGPVKISSDNPLGLVSERSLFGNSFEEVWSTSYDQLDSHYYWPVYMNQGLMTTWMLVSNPVENGETVHVHLIIETYPSHITADKDLAPGETWTPKYDNSNGAPADVQAYRVGGSPSNQADARKVIASERTLRDGAFNEMPGIPASKLSSHYLWTWYDSVNSLDSVFYGNPSYTDGVWVQIKLAGNPVMAPKYLPPRAVTAWRDTTSSMMNGPLEIFGCADQNCATPSTNLIASQASLYGPAYEETAGTPVSDIKPTANWTWYDDRQAAGSRNWILVANPNNSMIYYRIEIGGSVPAGYIGYPAMGTLGVGQRVTPRFPEIMTGPVQAKGCYVAFNPDGSCSSPADVFASQRVVWNGYFNEVVGKGM